MIALRLLPIIQVIVILCTPPILSIPIYGTKRYGQTYHMAPYRTMVRNTRYPINYYEPYPSSSNYADEYYTQDGFPLYYPRTSKYEVYQAVLPYYYQERPVARYGYNYYNYDDPVVDLQEEMMQEEAIKEREAAQPIGHEVMYENDYDETDDNDDTKVAFLQNLILTQMYKDRQREEEQERDRQRAYYDSLGYSYGDSRQFDDATEEPDYSDKDVEDLKDLAQHQNQNRHQYRKQKQDNFIPNWVKDQSNKKKVPNLFNTEAKRGSVNTKNTNEEKDSKKISNRKLIVKPDTDAVQTTEAPSKREGQKEIVMMRPATPVRNPFPNQVLQMMSKSDSRKRSPSVYETIKKMLDMEKSLEQQKQLEELRPSMKKRIISSEDSLIKQLTVLKKSQ